MHTAVPFDTAVTITDDGRVTLHDTLHDAHEDGPGAAYWAVFTPAHWQARPKPCGRRTRIPAAPSRVALAYMAITIMLSVLIAGGIDVVGLT